MDITAALQQFGGIARTRQLASVGVTRAAMARALDAQHAVRVSRGWYAQDRSHPAVPAVQCGGALSCVSAARAHGLWSGIDERLHLDIPRSADLTWVERRIPTKDAVFHWTRSPEPHWAASIERALLTMARCCDRETTVAAIDSALQLGLLLHPEWTKLARDHPYILEPFVDLVDGRAESGIESIVRLRLAKYRPEIQVDVPRVGRIDLMIGRLAIELDGYEFHSGRDDFERDRRKALALAAMGIHTIRLSYRQVMFGWDQSLRVLEAALAARSGVGAPSAATIAHSSGHQQLNRTKRS